MSQELHITAHHKADNDTSICLAWWGTSIARSDIMRDAFRDTDKDILIPYADFGERVRTVEQTVKQKKVYLAKLQLERKELQKLLIDCEDKPAAEALLERLDDTDLSIEVGEKDYEQWQYILTTLEIILNIYEDNKDNWDIYYSNC